MVIGSGLPEPGPSPGAFVGTLWRLLPIHRMIIGVSNAVIPEVEMQLVPK